MLPLKKDLKLVRQLHQKKFRVEHRLFIAEGKKMVEEAMASDFKLVALYTTDNAFAVQHSTAMVVTTREMEMMSALSNSSQHLAVLQQKIFSLNDLPESLLLVLDGIADPGNMGTIIRTADWFGISTILCTDDCVDIYNPKVVQSTMGSIFRLKVMSAPLDEIRSILIKNEYHTTGADLQGTELFQYTFQKKTALVIGSESHGIRKEMKAHLNDCITIPGSGNAESLNASVAAGIIMAAWKRQHL